MFTLPARHCELNGPKRVVCFAFSLPRRFRLEVSSMALSFAWLIRPDSLWSQWNSGRYVSCGHGHVSTFSLDSDAIATRALNGAAAET